MSTSLREAARRIVDAVGDYYDEDGGDRRIGCDQCSDTDLRVHHLRALRAALGEPLPPSGYRSVRSVMLERGYPIKQDAQFDMDDIAAAPFADDSEAAPPQGSAPQESLTVERLAELRREWLKLPIERRLRAHPDNKGIADEAYNYAEWLLPKLGARPAPPSEPPTGRTIRMKHFADGHTEELITEASPRLAEPGEPLREALREHLLEEVEVWAQTARRQSRTLDTKPIDSAAVVWRALLGAQTEPPRGRL